MYKDTKNFVRSCTVCLSRKNVFKIPPAPHPPIEQSQEPGETCHIDIFGPLKTTSKEMAARKRSAIDSVYIPDDLSDSESDFSFESDRDINFSDSSSSSDESDHASINLQSVRQWCKIDMKNVPPPPPSPVPFRGNPGITVNI
ncbi:hypothetical protein TNCV_5125841 [Trichonephila clavipes]|nr:hypothetical protein TNCV_5125841 [Trichonephila clavipes]